MTLPEPARLPTSRSRRVPGVPRPPAHLKADGKRTWQTVAAED